MRDAQSVQSDKPRIDIRWICPKTANNHLSIDGAIEAARYSDAVFHLFQLRQTSNLRSIQPIMLLITTPSKDRITTPANSLSRSYKEPASRM